MQLETVTGKLIDPQNPDPQDIAVQDIGWGLSRMSRFAGHTVTEIPYNVAQHSFYVADLVGRVLDNPESFVGLDRYLPNNKVDDVNLLEDIVTGGRHAIMLKALLHDASEVYTGDVPSPVKQIPELRPVFKKIEHGLMEAIYQSLGLTAPIPCEEGVIDFADKLAQRIEAYQYMPSRGKNWTNLPEASLVLIQEFPAPKPALASYQLFLDTFNDLYDQYLDLTKAADIR